MRSKEAYDGALEVMVWQMATGSALLGYSLPTDWHHGGQQLKVKGMNAVARMFLCSWEL